MGSGKSEKDETGQVSRHQITRSLEHRAWQFGSCTESDRRSQRASMRGVTVCNVKELSGSVWTMDGKVAQAGDDQVRGHADWMEILAAGQRKVKRSEMEST